MKPHILRRLVRPVSRPAALFLLWTHRRTVALWFRSFRTEFERARVEGHGSQRWKTLVSALWRVSKDSTIVQGNEPSRLVVADDDVHVVATPGTDTLEDVGSSWRSVEPTIGSA